MDDTGAILCQVSTLKDMLDKVNEEIEGSIQVTREIESEIVKCEQVETALAAREAELTQLLYLSQFELNGYFAVAANLRNSVASLLEEIKHQRNKRDDLLERKNKNRDSFTNSCIQFQRSLEGDDCSVLRALLLEKQSLEDEIHTLEQNNSSMRSSVSAFLDEILEDLHDSNSALEAEIERGNAENEQLMKQIDELKAILISSISSVDDPW